MHRIPALLLLLAGTGLPLTAAAQVKRCSTQDGGLVYTDRKCEDIGARERLPPPVTTSGGAYLRRNVCARSIQDLSHSLSSAIQSGDANRIAGLFDWAGMGTTAANRVMDRLELIASRTLVDVQPVFAGSAPPDDDVATFDPDTGQLLQRAAPRLAGLRAEQIQANGHTPSQATFWLRQRMGCWWLHL